MATNWENLEYRKSILKSIKDPANVARKKASYKRHRVWRGHLHDYVKDAIKVQMSEKTAEEMPIISSVNLSETIINNEASIYKNTPTRNFQEITDTDKEALDLVYFDGKFNKGFKKANRCFRLHRQCWIQPMLKNGKITQRVLLPHHVDVVASSADPETNEAIIVSSFNPSLVTDEKKAADERYSVWTNEINFIMDGNGALKTKITPNPIGMIPIREVSDDKDFTQYVDFGDTLTEFTVQYNVGLSDVQQIVRLQGFGIIVYKAVKETVPNSIRLGPNVLLHIPINPANTEATGDIQVVSPNPNIEGAIKQLESLLSNFLSSRGHDTKMIAGALGQADRFASGLERLLAMIDRFEASKDDIELFHGVEDEVFEVTKRYLAYYSKSNKLGKKYHTSAKIMNSSMSVQYKRPEIVLSETEKVAYAKSRMDLGEWTIIDAIMYVNEVDEDEAIKRYKRKQKLELMLKPKVTTVELPDGAKPGDQVDQVENTEGEDGEAEESEAIAG